MKPGDIVRVKVKETGEKVRAVVTDIRVDTEMVDVTRSGMFGDPVDTFRQSVPGRTTTTITLEVIS